MLIALAVSFLAAHLPFLARTPATVDSANFSLGVTDFNVADHRPHPPGYPVVIALGKISLAVLQLARPHDPVLDAVRALAIWSVLFGTLGILVLFQFFRALEMDGRRATAATALAVTCPLFWFNAVRPMSDIPGLVAGLSAQALLLMAVRPVAEWPRQRLLVIGAAAAGVAIGFRTQNSLLTVPLLLWVAVHCRPPLKLTAHMTVAFSIGVLLWAVPLVLASGGPMAYLAALGAQAHEDFAGTDMLATGLTLRRLAMSLVLTFAYPWANTELATVMIGLSLMGAGMLLARSRPVTLALAAATVPYAVFHLLFQESTHTRYALPLVPAMAYLVVHGLDALAARLMPWLVGGLSVASVLVVFPSVAIYARAGNPAHDALLDIRAHASNEKTHRVLAMHHGVARVLRGQHMPLRTLPSPPKHEWLELVKHWQGAPDTPVWFLADAGRDDLALLDPGSRRRVRSYTWSFPRKFLMSRVPMSTVEWYELIPPGWMAAEGWSLSQESGGVAFRDRRERGDRPALAFVRRRDEAAVVMVGGSNPSGATGSSANVELSIDGRSIDSWNVGPGQQFLRMWQLPAGALAGPGRYVPLHIRTTPVGGKAQSLAIHQFDVQSVASIVYGFDSGWYEREYDGVAPRPWRWSGPSGVVRVHHAGRDVRLHVVGEVPLQYLTAAPRISVRAGDQVLARFAPRAADIDFDVRVPGSALDRSGGLLAIETDRPAVPAEVSRNRDKRRLGVRVYQLELRED